MNGGKENAKVSDGASISHEGSTRAAKESRRSDAQSRPRGSLEDRNPSADERVRAELEQERMIVRALMANIPDCIYFKDRESRFVRISRSHARMFGLKDPADAIGKTDFDFFSREHAETAYADEQEILRTGVPMVGSEEKQTWPDGREDWVSTTKAPLYDSEGRICGTFGITRDITRQKRFEHEHRTLEMHLHQLQKTESMAMLAGGIAHDFNNLLTGILGHVSLAGSKAQQDAAIQSHLKGIEDTALRAADLSKQLMAYAGQARGVMEPVDLGALAGEMARLLEISVSKNVRLIFETAPDLPTVEGDPTQLRQVIMNLITNASDAIGDAPGEVRVRLCAADCDEAFFVQTTHVGPMRAGRYVRLDVSDTGGGVPTEIRGKIFDPFFTTKRQGRGLGLATVIGAVNSHKGAIKLESVTGKGSTFSIYLPASRRQARAAIEEVAAPWRGSGTVLIVDDEHLIRHVAAQICAVVGFKVLTAESGEKAISCLKAAKGEIVAAIVDEIMPGMSGSEVCEELKKVAPDLPVLMCSGYSEKEIAGKSKCKCVSGFLQKPFTLQSLSSTLKSVVQTNAGRNGT